MSKEKKKIEKSDLIPPDIYTKSRKQIRKDLIEFKKIEELHLDLMQIFILKVLKLCWLKFKKCFILKRVEMSN